MEFSDLPSFSRVPCPWFVLIFLLTSLPVNYDFNAMFLLQKLRVHYNVPTDVPIIYPISYVFPDVNYFTNSVSGSRNCNVD